MTDSTNKEVLLMPNIYHPFSMCPHCLKQDVTFLLVNRFMRSDYLWHTLWLCQNCQLALGALINSGSAYLFNSIESLEPSKLLQFKSTWSFAHIYPEPSSIDAPLCTPQDINHFYRQGLHNLKAQNYDACGMMMRKVLESTTKAFLNSGGSLYARIEAMKNQNLITPDLADWAHEIRDVGNDAAHEAAPFSAKDAKDITKFTELFLMYVYTLPGMLAARRQVSSS